MNFEQQDIRIKAAVQAERMLLLEWLERERCNNPGPWRDRPDSHVDGWMDAFTLVMDHIWDRANDMNSVHLRHENELS